MKGNRPVTPFENEQPEQQFGMAFEIAAPMLDAGWPMRRVSWAAQLLRDGDGYTLDGEPYELTDEDRAAHDWEMA